MQKIRLNTEIERFEDSRELPNDEQSLLESAISAMHNAYAPYSRFKVGAALQLENGMVILGNNQENAAYPSGLCAERVAFYAASANYPGVSMLKVAITATSLDFPTENPISPCGACRQSMLEYEINQIKPITVLLKGNGGVVFRIHGVKQLLPIFFNEEGLKSR